MAQRIAERANESRQHRLGPRCPVVQSLQIGGRCEGRDGLGVIEGTIAFACGLILRLVLSKPEIISTSLLTTGLSRAC